MTPWVGYAYEVECSDFGCGTAFPECDCMTFDVNYNGGDGLGSAPTVPTSCTYGTTCLAPENTFYRADYQFSHWACKLPNGSECSKAIYYVGEDISQAIVSTEESITLTAAWVPANAFTIQYNTFGGVLSTEAVNKKTSCTETSETLVLPTATEITRANSTFKGWKNAKTNQMVTEIPAGTCNSEFVLEAQWSCNTGFASNADATACDAIVYNITYNLNGGTNNSSNPLTYKITDDDIVFVAPTRANSKFEGWFSDSMFTTAKTQITKGSTGDQAVYAKWSCNDGYTSNADNTACLANTITIAYDESKGAEISNGTCTYGETFTIADATSRTGYTFARWKLANGTLVDGGTQIVCNNTTLGVVNGTTNAVVAQWTANQYVVSYECDSSDPESLSPAPENISYDSEYTVLASHCAKKGYTFTGWTVSDTDTVVNPGDKFVWNYTSNKTLTARWSINSYKCESGEYLAAGATSCSECEAGSYCVGGTYDYSAVQTQGKSTCGTNSYSDAGAGSCTDCATDYTNSDDHAGIASCKITCPAGTYVAEAGKGCVSVETGYYGLGGTVGQDDTLARTQCPEDYREGSAATQESDCMGSCTVACSGNAVCPENSIDCTHDSSVVSRGTHTHGNQSCNAVVVECPVSGFGCAAGYNKTSEGCIAGDMNAITYNLDGGKINGGKVESCNVESSTIVLPTDVTKIGYTFDGWYDANGEEVEQIEQGTCIAPITLTARWSINSYKCESGEYLAAGATSCSECEAGSYCVGGTYDYSAVQTQGISQCPEGFGMGGTGLTSESACVGGCTVSCEQQTCPDNSTNCVHGNEVATGTMTYGNQECSATAPECSMTFDCKTGYNKVDESCIAGDMNAITYNLDGGKINGGKVESCNVESSTIVLPTDVTKIGYTFDGWYDANGEEVEQIEQGTCLAPITLTARWTACTPCKAGTGASCELSVVNNKCVYTTKCEDNYYNEHGAGTSTPSCESCVKSCSDNSNGFTLGDYNVCEGGTAELCYRNCVVGDVLNAYAVSGTLAANGTSSCIATSCVSNSYLTGGKCTNCDTGYVAPNGNTGGVASCTKSCEVLCSGEASCPSNATCEYDTTYKTSGTQVQGGKCSATAVKCPMIEFECNNGYRKTADGKSCERAEYQIVYNLDGGTNFVGAPQKYTAGTGAIVEGTPRYAGRVFEAWCLDAAKTNCNDMVVISETATGDVNLWVKWSQCPAGYYCDGVKSQCPPSHPESVAGAYSVQDCYKKCEERIEGNTVAAPVADKAYYAKQCEYNAATACKPGYHMVDGRCAECPYDKNILTYKKGCEVESCVSGYHPNANKCESDIISCVAPNAIAAQREWDSVKKAYGACTITKCATDYRLALNVCVPSKEVCEVPNGIGIREWNDDKNAWDECVVTSCNPGYTNDRSLTNEGWKQCGRCNNAFSANGELAVSSYVRECEIATCLYQGELYTLENNECRLICDDYSDETGRRYWDSKRKKCVHECGMGYINW